MCCLSFIFPQLLSTFSTLLCSSHYTTLHYTTLYITLHCSTLLSLHCAPLFYSTL